jgi:bis(5'-nucleosyl)-tetraphosphatase (symmetrical)
MALYLIGDLQGCLEPLQQLLRQVDFSPSRDTLYPLGDLVNRGPHSLGVLRTLMALQDAARPVLGNHDLHLLACAAGVRPAGRRDTLQGILQAPDRPALLDWLRQQPLARLEHGWLMVHAGVLPDWTSAITLELAGQVSEVLRSAQWSDFFHHMYGNQPERWHERLQGWDRLRVIVNGLTRLRFCTPDGAMEFEANGPPSQAPEGYRPWFEVPGRRTLGQSVAFGHWSTLSIERLDQQPGWIQETLGLDTGCLWGRRLTAARLGGQPGQYELISVPGQASWGPQGEPGPG